MKYNFIRILTVFILIAGLSGCRFLSAETSISVTNTKANDSNKQIKISTNNRKNIQKTIVVTQTQTTQPEISKKEIEEFIKNEKSYMWKDFPLNVYIIKDKNYNIALKAFNIWQSHTPKQIFKITNDKNSADIIFEFMPDNSKFADKVTSPGNSCPQGYTYYHYSYQIINGVKQPPYMDKANIYVSLNRCKNMNESLPEDELLWVSMHEIGHALGLTHSSNKQDIMYPIYSANPDTDSMNDFRKFLFMYNLG